MLEEKSIRIIEFSGIQLDWDVWSELEIVGLGRASGCISDCHCHCHGDFEQAEVVISEGVIPVGMPQEILEREPQEEVSRDLEVSRHIDLSRFENNQFKIFDRGREGSNCVYKELQG